MYLENQTKNFASVKQVSWEEVRGSYSKKNPELSQIFDQINPDKKKLPLIKVGYSFGDFILEKGKFLLPQILQQEKTGLSHRDTQLLCQWLSYSCVPFGLFLNKSGEVFLETQEKVSTVFTISPGYFMGLFETLDWICDRYNMPIWNFTAGARSLFMIPKINNIIGHKRLQKTFNITTTVPQSLQNHWNVFVDLVRATKIDWQCDVVFLTEPWFKLIRSNDTAWVQLREYLFKACWVQKLAAIEKTFSFIWQQFSTSTMKRRFKPRIYITDTIRHLMSIAYSLVPAFIPSINDNAAPVSFLQKVYKEVYQLENYFPTLMESTMLSKDTPSVYYSLGYPTLLEGDLETNTLHNTINDLKEIKLLIENVTQYCKNYLSYIKQFQEFTDQVHFDYFHKIADPYGEIKISSELPKENKQFLKSQTKLSGNMNFCSAGPFLNGCINIQRDFLSDCNT
jgi:hypothetical protein